MLKLMFFLWRRPGMSEDSFGEYYDRKHFAFCVPIVPQLELCDHRRNYPVWSRSGTNGAAEICRYFEGLTVMSECWHPNRRNFQSALEIMARPNVRDRLAAEEENFIDRKRELLLVVDEVVTEAASRLATTPGKPVDDIHKITRYVSASPDVSIDSFKQRFESECVPHITKLLKNCLSYRRNYLRYDDPLSTPVAFRKFALIEEFWLAAPGGAPTEIPAIEADRALVEPGRIYCVHVEERRYTGGGMIAAPVARARPLWRWEDTGRVQAKS